MIRAAGVVQLVINLTFPASKFNILFIPEKTILCFFAERTIKGFLLSEVKRHFLATISFTSPYVVNFYPTGIAQSNFTVQI